jgi:hypothetical protein
VWWVMMVRAKVNWMLMMLVQIEILAVVEQIHLLIVAKHIEIHHSWILSVNFNWITDLFLFFTTIHEPFSIFLYN